MAVNISTLAELIDSLTWTKIIQTTILILILGISWGLWENRATIYNSLKVTARIETDNALVLNLSNTTIFLLDDTTAKMKSLIGGMQVVNVDFKKNSRSSSYFAFSDINLKTAFANYQASKIADVPLFTDSEVNNQRIINLINGEFICNDFKDTMAIKAIPRAADTITTICAISIPPYYGRFSGYMNIYLLRKPTVDETTAIRQIARDVSLKIYETDVDKSNRYAEKRT
jgi:hypothetical protein